jgi:hypothetical protein
MTHDAAVTGHAAEGLETHGRASDELGSPDTIRQRIDVGHEVQRVAIGIGGARGSFELPVAGANEVEQGIEAMLTGSCGEGFS